MVFRESEKPDILQVVQSAGVELSRRGARFWGICPFHAEKTPSFSVNPEKERWKCFGCGESGDTIDFIQKFRGISFSEAVRLLRIPGELRGSRGQAKKFDPQVARRQALTRAFQAWCNFTAKELSDLLWMGNLVDTVITKPEHLEISGLSEMYRNKEVVGHWLDVLSGDDFEAKLRLYRHMKEATGLCNIN